jgi:SNF2 family DNA or RNA helicase
MALGLVKRVLVICPLSIMKSAWQQDLFKFAIHRTVTVAYGAARKRKELVGAGAEFVIINFDGVGIVKKEIMDGGFDLIVVDEASAYKNAQTARWKDLRDLTKVIKGLWMLTGTPAAQSPVDAYGLAKLVNPKGVPPFFGQFRDSVMNKITAFKWAAKPTAQAVVHNILQPAIRFEKSQCLDLPPVTFAERDAPLTPQQQKYYTMLKKQLLIEAAGEEISAINAAVLVNKLLQVAGGAVYSDTGEVIEFDVSNRLNVVQEVIEESSHKVLVFIPFTHTIELLQKHLTKNGISCDVINGAVPVNRRSDIVKQFQEQPEPKVLLIQPKAASHGLTLTAANTIVWYAPCNSVETYLQANARIDRPGQVNNMTVVHIKGSPVEAKMYSMLQGNIVNHQKVIDLFRKEISSEDY